MSRNLTIKACSLIIIFSAGFSHAETVRVATKENAIREDCRFLAPVKGRVQYGDELEVTAKEGDWIKVRLKSIKGCIHKSAVTDKQVKISDVPSRGYSASGDEVALAGKGFNPEVEKAYKNKHPELDFNAVNSIEEYKVPEEALKTFIQGGDLKQP